MKRYKLLKDTPTIKAGTIFEEVVSDFDELKELVRITPVEAKTSPQWTIQDIDNFDDWFEEIKEFEEWRPKKGEPFKMMTNLGRIVEHFCWEGSDEDRRILSLGNCYPLSTPDKVIDKEQRLIPQAMHRLKIEAKKAWFKFSLSDEPNWSNRFQEKWKISYDHSTDIFLSTVNHIEQFGNLPCFPTEESAQAIIDTMKDDLKLIFGVK